MTLWIVYEVNYGHDPNAIFSVWHLKADAERELARRIEAEEYGAEYRLGKIESDTPSDEMIN